MGEYCFLIEYNFEVLKRHPKLSVTLGEMSALLNESMLMHSPEFDKYQCLGDMRYEMDSDPKVKMNGKVLQVDLGNDVRFVFPSMDGRTEVRVPQCVNQVLLMNMLCNLIKYRLGMYVSTRSSNCLCSCRCSVGNDSLVVLQRYMNVTDIPCGICPHAKLVNVRCTDRCIKMDDFIVAADDGWMSEEDDGYFSEEEVYKTNKIEN